MVPVLVLAGCDADTIAPDSVEGCETTSMLLGYSSEVGGVCCCCFATVVDLFVRSFVPPACVCDICTACRRSRAHAGATILCFLACVLGVGFCRVVGPCCRALCVYFSSNLSLGRSRRGVYFLRCGRAWHALRPTTNRGCCLLTANNFCSVLRLTSSLVGDVLPASGAALPLVLLCLCDVVSFFTGSAWHGTAERHRAQADRREGQGGLAVAQVPRQDRRAGVFVRARSVLSPLVFRVLFRARTSCFALLGIHRLVFPLSRARWLSTPPLLSEGCSS